MCPGKYDLDELMIAGILAWARDLAHGKMSDVEIERLKKDTTLFGLISVIAEKIKTHGDLTRDDVSGSLPKESRISHWRSMSSVANFLKHADFDADRVLALKGINTDLLLLHAFGAFAMVSPAEVTPEMRPFYFYWMSMSEDRSDVKDEDLEFVEWLAELSPARRRRAWARYVRLLKKA